MPFPAPPPRGANQSPHRDQSPPKNAPGASGVFGQAFGGPRASGSFAHKRSFGNVSSSSDSSDSGNKGRRTQLPLPKRQNTAPSAMSAGPPSTTGPPQPARLQRSSTMGVPPNLSTPDWAALMSSASSALANVQAGQLQALGYTVPSNVNRLPAISGPASTHRPPVITQRARSSRSATNSPSPPLSKHASRENLRPAWK